MHILASVKRCKLLQKKHNLEDLLQIRTNASWIIQPLLFTSAILTNKLGSEDLHNTTYQILVPVGRSELSIIESEASSLGLFLAEAGSRPNPHPRTKHWHVDVQQNSASENWGVLDTNSFLISVLWRFPKMFMLGGEEKESLRGAPTSWNSSALFFGYLDSTRGLSDFYCYSECHMPMIMSAEPQDPSALSLEDLNVANGGSLRWLDVGSGPWRTLEDPGLQSPPEIPRRFWVTPTSLSSTTAMVLTLYNILRIRFSTRLWIGIHSSCRLHSFLCFLFCLNEPHSFISIRSHG